MPRRRDEDEREPAPDESSVTQYDSPSDSTQGSEHSSQSGHTTHSTSLHSGRSRRLPAPVPVHAQGLYRADGMYHALDPDVRLAQEKPSHADGGVPLRRAPSMRSVRGMYDPELHEPPPPPPRAGEAVSGDSLSYGSQPEYVHYVNPPPASGMGPYSWADSSSGTSQELYFRGHRKYLRRSFCSVCLSVSIVTVIIAVIGIVAIAAYLGVMTTDDSEALKYEMQYSGKFRVARGDFYHPSLADTSSADFQDKAEHYKKMIETLYEYSYLSDAFRRASVERFGNDSLTVFFRVHLDRRKIPTSVLNTEEAVRDVVTQEVMSLEPRAFRSVSVDIDSIEIQREQKDGASNAPFISRSNSGGSRLQSRGDSPMRPAASRPGPEAPEREHMAHPTATPAPKHPNHAAGDSPTETVAAAAPPAEAAKERPPTEAGPEQAPDTPVARDGDGSAEPAAEQDVAGDDVEVYGSDDVDQATEVTAAVSEVNVGSGSTSTPEKTGESAAVEPEPLMNDETVDEKRTEKVKAETATEETMTDAPMKETMTEMKTKEAMTEPLTEKTMTETTTEEAINETAPAGNSAIEVSISETEMAERPVVNGVPSANKNSAVFTENEGSHQVDHVPEESTVNELVPDNSSSVGSASMDHIPENNTPDGGHPPNSSPTEHTPTKPVQLDFYPTNLASEDFEPTYDDDDADDATGESASDDYGTFGAPASDDDDAADAATSDDVATELAPLLAASVALGVDRIGYVDTSAPANAHPAPRPADRPYYTDVQVGTAYFGGLGPAPASPPIYSSASDSASPPAPGSGLSWGPARDTASASDPAPIPAPSLSGDDQISSWSQPGRPETASQPGPTDQKQSSQPLYDFSPWNPIIPAFAQSPNLAGGAGPSGSLFPDAGVLRRGGSQPSEVTVRPRPEPSRPGQEYEEDDDSADEDDTSAAVAATRRPYVQAGQLQSSDQSSIRRTQAPPPLPESVSVQHTLNIVPKNDDDDDDTDSPADFISPTPFRPRPPSSFALPSSGSQRNPAASRPFLHPAGSPPSASGTQYRAPHTRPQGQTDEPAQSQRRVTGSQAHSQLFQPAGDVNRLGIALFTRPPTRRPVTPPATTTTQRVVVVNAAPLVGSDGTAPRPTLQQAAAYSEVYRPSLPWTPSAFNPITPPTPEYDRKEDEEQDDVEEEDDSVVASPNVVAGLAPQRPLPSASGSSLLAGALGGALTGAANGPEPLGGPSAPSREQLLNLFRLIALRYPALVANMDQQQLRVLLNDEEARRKLLAPFLGKDRSRTPSEPQRTNTKLLELANISINGTNSNRDSRSHRVPLAVAGGPPSRQPPTRRPFISRLNSSVLKALANFTRVKVAGGLPSAARPLAAPTRPLSRPLPTPTGSLSDRLQLVGFPTRAPPHGGNDGNGTTSSSRGKLSHKLMRFHGERTNADGGEYERAAGAAAPLFAALRVTTLAPPRGERRHLLRHTTRLPNSSPVHVIRYREGESVQDILDKIFARFHQRPSQNEVEAATQKPWSGVGAASTPLSTVPVRPVVSVPGRPSTSTGRPVPTPVLPSLATRELAASAAVSRPPSVSWRPQRPESEPDQDQDQSEEQSDEEEEEEQDEEAVVAEEADNEVGTADPEKEDDAEVPARPTLASLLRNHTVASCTNPSDFACVTLGGCVPASARCDRLLDCADGSDERHCSCADRLRAQSMHGKLCDGVIDCHDSSDEKFCEWCRPDQFICPEAKHCVDRSALCDGKFDCADGADERHCVTIDTSAAAAAAGQSQYQPSGLLLVRKRGVWGRLCVDDLDSLVRQSRGRWGATELGRAVCKALTYQDAKEVRRMGPSVLGTTALPTEDPFFKLLFTQNTLLPEPEKASLMFAEDTCARQTALHVTCEKLQCGLRPRIRQRQARIVGGGNSSPGAWPWQAAMYREGEYQCGATLISDRWLVSAGHCYLRSTSQFWLARLGAYRRGGSLLSPYEQLRPVSHIIMHPDYQDVGYVHDIALLRLKEPVRMSDFVRPACLPTPKTDVQNGALCTVVGWGQLFESGKIFPDTLQEVQVPVISSQECRKRTVFLPLYKITENMFCAGYERGGRDACLGDSGGPLMCQEPSGEWTLTGITSNGYGCARAGRPGVYTKVVKYASWIERITSSSLPPAQRHSCQGHRCRLGRCLSPTEVCDGIVHCSDGSDEADCPAGTASA